LILDVAYRLSYPLTQATMSLDGMMFVN
jgi:hypothetical protein